jgi:PHD/YefM family antitoxin component YafN of YafNO toxin-antitoxin module
MITLGEYMKSTTPKNLRSELKHYLEISEKEPIKIKRRSGKSFILLGEAKYNLLIDELLILRNKIKEIDADFSYVPSVKKEKIIKATKKVTKKLQKKTIKKKK